MTKSKRTNSVCLMITAATVALTILFCFAPWFGITVAATSLPYESRIFDDSYVHTIDISVDDGDWQDMLDNAENEEYIVCDVTIDGESVKSVGIRPKGNSSLSTVASSDSDRYSFKIEFDHYYESQTYYGLDKLSLNNCIQDNTYLKDYLCYDMMRYAGALAPLCSFVWITVNGEDWGLYTAVEAVEESFLQRNFGSSYGELYKPDSLDMNNFDDFENAGDIDISDIKDKMGNFGTFDFGGISDNGDFTPPDMPSDTGDSSSGETPDSGDAQSGSNGEIPDMSDAQGGFSGQMPDMSAIQGGFGGDMGAGGTMSGSSDTSLIYTDDEISSYSNIFDNAKTDPTESDKKRLISSLKSLNEQTDIDKVVDTDEVISYFVAHTFVLNGDSYTGSMIHNYYLYEEDGQMSMIAWDYNLAFGAFSMGGGQGTGSSDATSTVNSPIDTPVLSGSVEDRPMLSWIFSDESYTEQYHEAFDSFISGYFESGYFSEKYASVVEMISPYVERDPTSFCTYEEFLTAVDTLESFCEKRAESIRGQLDGTILSTSDGQSEDSSSFVDASDISISDMGSFGGNGGGNGGGKGFANNEGDAQASFDISKMSVSDDQSSQDFSFSLMDAETPQMNGETPQMNGETLQMSGDMPQMNGDMPQMNGDMPQNDGETPQTSEETTQPAEETTQAAEETTQTVDTAQAAAETTTAKETTQAVETIAQPAEETVQETQSETETASPDDETQQSDAETQPQNGDSQQFGGDMPQQNGNAPQMGGGFTQSDGSSSSSVNTTLILTLSSAAILAIGLAFALLYRRK